MSLVAVQVAKQRRALAARRVELLVNGYPPHSPEILVRLDLTPLHSPDQACPPLLLSTSGLLPRTYLTNYPSIQMITPPQTPRENVVPTGVPRF